MSARRSRAVPLNLGESLLAAVAPAAANARPRSKSVRAKKHDWMTLHENIRKDGSTVIEGPVIVSWDERYVHAIEKALAGRKLDELLALLEARRFLHPSLLPILADVMRSQRDGRGRPQALTQVQDHVIRSVVDRMGSLADAKWLASVYGVSEGSIEESLDRTKPKEK